MSSMRALSGIRSLPVLAATAAILVTALSGIGAAQTPDNGNRPQAAVGAATTAGPSSTSAENHLDKTALQAFWSNYIWQSIPARDLRSLNPGPVSKAYEANNWQPFFINSRFEPNSKAQSLLARLRSVGEDALDPGPFELDRLSEILEKLDSYRSALRAADPQFEAGGAQSFFEGHPPVASTTEAQASNEPAAHRAANRDAVAKDYRRCFHAASQADVRFTTDFFLFSRVMDRFLPFEDGLKVLLGNAPLSTYFVQLEPKGFGYHTLRSAYERYRELAASGAQQYVYFSSPARLGDSGKEIGLLQKRLQQEGFYSGHITGVYDRTTQQAVRKFQKEHMLRPDGVVGAHTIRWLNVPFKQKEALIAYSMRAVRNSPTRRFHRFIRINIPQFMLSYYNNGKLEKSDKVVVGKASGKKVDRRGRLVGENQTPTFVSKIVKIVFNPRWYVDGRIRLELNKDAKSDPDWFEEHGYVKMESRYASGEHRLFQKSGPQNALGRVKFEFPNPYVVYLHDTPEKYLFDKTRRDFSHGCIRVDNALDLAQTILDDEGNPYVEKMHSILKGTRQVFVKLSKPIPISVEYIPVVAGGDGQVLFAGDPYGLVTEPSELAQK